MNNPFKSLQPLSKHRFYYSLLTLEEQGIAEISRLPISIRIMLEALLRNCDGNLVTEEDVLHLAKWNAKKVGHAEVPFIVSRVILQDFTGVPLLVDLAAMREAVADQKKDPNVIEPDVPVDLVIDHSVQVDRAGTDDAFLFNLKTEFQRNKERYELLKWGQQAFKTFKVVPPGIGIVHQVNLEFIATVVTSKKIEGGELLYFDTLVGTDSHTTMINGLGVLGWGVGGIEAEAAMLGQPVAMQMPEVIGVHMTGKLQEGVTATDLTLRVTEMLRKEKVVEKFVEFFGDGAASLSVADRATIGNMSPEYGATIGFFPADEKTLQYLAMTGRSKEKVAEVEEYLRAQKMFGIPKKGEVDYTKVLELDLSTIRPSVAGPKRPQDRIHLTELKNSFQELLTAPPDKGGYGKKLEEKNRQIFIHAGGSFLIHGAHADGGTRMIGPLSTDRNEEEMVNNRPFTNPIANPGYTEYGKHEGVFHDGSIVIAAITSCTNTSNPSVMIGAGLLAKKAVELGLTVNPLIKTSLAPGSRVVTDYLEKTGLQRYLNDLGFHLVAYGCTTCIGNSGPLDEKIEEAIKSHDLIAASVLSGNRNFEARIHSSVKANFLMSPPLVVAFAIAGRVDIDMTKEPLGKGKDGKEVFLKDIWPQEKEIEKAIEIGIRPQMFSQRYSHILTDNPVWKEITGKTGARYPWDPGSTYIQKPPFFAGFTSRLPKPKEFKNMRALALFKDSVTTDHISPAGAFSGKTPAGQYLAAKGVKEGEFNSYGSRRGNHNIMMRGTFANVRIRNALAAGKEGGFTRLMPEGTILPIFEAAEIYSAKKVPLIVFAGKDYGMGSSRDWAAKGTALLGVVAVVAKSFERIHRSNLIGMGVLPLVFQEGEDWESVGITGDEEFSFFGFEPSIRPEVTLDIGKGKTVALTACLETPVEVEYYKHGGILPYTLRRILSITGK